MPELRDFPEARWKALAELLIRKRVEISPRYCRRSVFCREHGLNYRMVYDLEKTRRQDFSLPTIIAFEQIYQLGPGFFRRFLAGREAEDEPTTKRAA